jgi:hypothetical protein
MTNGYARPSDATKVLLVHGDLSLRIGHWSLVIGGGGGSPITNDNYAMTNDKSGFQCAGFPRRWLAALCIVLLLALSAPASAATWEGIDVNVDADWPGCGRGGYYPIRITVVNRGQPRVMDFTFNSNYGRMPSVSKTLAVQTERVSFSLLVPCVGQESYGTVRVRVDGQNVNELLQSVSTPPLRSYDVQGPAVLLIDTKDTDWTQFKTALETILGVTTTTPGGGYSYSGSITAGDDHKYIVPEALPGEWQAYTGLDIVTLTANTLKRLDSEDRTAITKWVESGGTLLVYDAGKANPADTVDAILNAGGAAPSGAWQDYDVGAQWWARDRLLGRVVAVANDPFHEFSSSDWESLLRSLGRDRWEWVERYGFSARYASTNFMDFLIPSIKGVPVIAFLVLITLFAIVIGPLNYFYLWKQRRLYLLVVTIPLIALITSASLFGYSVIAHGFSTRARVRSLTLVDQPSNTAVCSSRVSLYSGLAPSAGLDSSRESAGFPIWAPDAEFESGSVDWTDSQHFASGWLRSRTRTQFFVTTHRNERGRLEVTPEPQSLSISNGFEWDLDTLVVGDDEGRLYHGTDIAAGAGARLEPLTSEQTSEFIRRIARDPLVAPAYAPTTPTYGYGGGMYYGGYSMPATSYNTNQAERLIQSLAQHNTFTTGPGRARWYAAILADDPGVDVGMTTAREEASLHVLMGKY